MDDIRCPNCGQINSASASTCWKCQTPLQPTGETPSGFDRSGAQDWLSDLRSGSTLSSDEISSEESGSSDEVMDFGQNQTSSDEVPEWLVRIRERTRSEGNLSPLGNPLDRMETPGNDVPDWLKALSADDPQPSEDSQENPFLSNFSQPEPEPPAAPPAAAPSENDWLGDFRSKVQFSSEPANENPDTSQDSAACPEPVSAEPNSPETSFPSWDQPETAQPGEPSGPETGSETAANSDDEWLKEFQIGVPAQTPPEIPDHETVDGQAGSAPQEQNVQASEEIPDWMKAFDPFGFTTPADSSEAPQENRPAETLPSEEMPETGATQNIPDWLSAGDKLDVTSSPAASTNAYFVDAPDWLTENTDPGTPSPQDQGPSEPEVPVTDAASSNEPEDALAGQDIPSIDPNEIPDWLKSDEPFESPTGPTPVFVGDLSEVEAPPTPAAQPMPEWLSEVKPEPPSETGNTPAFIVEDEANLNPVEPIRSQPFSAEDIPDWLSEPEAETGTESEPESPVAAALAAAPEEGEELAPAQLPGWLQAMRPVEALAPAAAVKSDDRRIENNGPLAGLQGVLPGENLARRYRKPPAYSVKLRVSEKQRTYATQLEQMLGDEQKPQAAKSQPGGLPRWAIRAVLAVVLIAAIVFSVPGANVPQSSLEMLNFSNQIEALPNQAPVLLAIEYDAGFAGEMRMASLGLVERLLAHNTRIALVSTVPAGPVLGNELINLARQELQNRNETGAANTQVVNLGYLAGGITSLQEFSLHPQTATQYGFASDAGAPVWNQDVLSGVNSIDAFAAVIVLTDDGDTGRAWVEQVKPRLGSTPLFFVSSAQAAPMLQPYADSGQINSLVSGLSGGISYNRLAQNNVDLYTWGAYRGSLYLGIVFILIGILSKAMLSALPRRKA
jgi:hypothetical protein